MEFCDECGSRMKNTKNGYLCQKCGNLVRFNAIEVKKVKRSFTESIYVIEDEYIGEKVNRMCPKCGNDQAFRRLSSITGEHAGVAQERTLESFKCTRCLHSWGESK